MPEDRDNSDSDDQSNHKEEAGALCAHGTLTRRGCPPRVIDGHLRDEAAMRRTAHDVVVHSVWAYGAKLTCIHKIGVLAPYIGTAR